MPPLDPPAASGGPNGEDYDTDHDGSDVMQQVVQQHDMASTTVDPRVEGLLADWYG